MINEIETTKNILEITDLLPSLVAIAVVIIGGLQTARREKLIMKNKQQQELYKIEREEKKQLFIRLNRISSKAMKIRTNNQQNTLTEKTEIISECNFELMEIHLELVLLLDVSTTLDDLFDTAEVEKRKIDKMEKKTKEQQDECSDKYLHVDLNFILGACSTLKAIIHKNFYNQD